MWADPDADRGVISNNLLVACALTIHGLQTMTLRRSSSFICEICNSQNDALAHHGKTTCIYWATHLTYRNWTQITCPQCQLSGINGTPIMLATETWSHLMYCQFYYQGSLLLTLFQHSSQHGYVITSIVMCSVKLLIHSQYSTVHPLMFGNG